jgi:hypothetical protein
MTYERYNPRPAGRQRLGDDISLTSTQIYFGKNKPDFDYLVIEYDQQAKAIRFSAGDKTTAYRVRQNKSNSYYINTRNFLKLGYLPRGWYVKTAKYTYKYKENQ